MNFRNFIIEKHVSQLQFHVARSGNGKYKIHFTAGEGGDAEVRHHAAAHAALELTKSMSKQEYDSAEQAEAAAREMMNSHSDDETETENDMEEEAPVNNIGSNNIAGINPPAGPAPLAASQLHGIATGYSPEAIAKKHGVSLKHVNKQLEMGTEVEQEHTDNAATARKIAMDHVLEDPDYYTKLRKMEHGDKKNTKTDIGNNTVFRRGEDPLAKYRTPLMQTRRSSYDKPM